VPTFTWGLFLSNFSLDMTFPAHLKIKKNQSTVYSIF